MEQNTQEWLDFRRNKIGASDAAAIMGVSPWKTPYQLFEEKVYGKTQEQTGAMRRGSFYEEEARSSFESMTGVSVMPKVIVSHEREWQMASLDGVSFDGTIFTEIKVPNKEAHELAKKGIIADYYNIQMQHQYAADPKLKQGLYFSYLPDLKEGVIVEVKKDELLIDEINEEEEKFFDYMVRKEPPPLTDKDYFFQESEEWIKMAEEWKELSAYIESLKESQEELRDKLIAFSNGQNSKGAGIRITKSICKGLVDYKKIPELIGVDLEPFRKPSIEKWTLASCK